MDPSQEPRRIIDDLSQSSRLRNILWGGGVRLPEQVAEAARGVGFTGVQIVAPGAGGTLRAIVAQRPP